jgi:hypothetical protein
LKQEEGLPSLLFNFALEYAIRTQVNQDGLQLKDKHQLLVYTDHINIGWNRIIVKKNTKLFIL